MASENFDLGVGDDPFDALDYRPRTVYLDQYQHRESITINLTDAAARILFVEAALSGMTEEQVAASLLDRWSVRQFQMAVRISQALNNPATPAPRLMERDIERRIFECVCAAGIPAISQKDCGVGIADLVTDQAVVEVKLRITYWRELHQACGQAKAYAAALNRPVCIVTAEFIEPKLLTKAARNGVEVLSVDQTIERLIGLGD